MVNPKTSSRRWMGKTEGTLLEAQITKQLVQNPRIVENSGRNSSGQVCLELRM